MTPNILSKRKVKTNLCKFEKTQVTQSVFSDHGSVRSLLRTRWWFYEFPCMLKLIQLQLASTSVDSSNCGLNMFKERAQMSFLSLSPKQYSRRTTWCLHCLYSVLAKCLGWLRYTAGWGQVICRYCATQVRGLRIYTFRNLLGVLEPVPPGYRRMTVYFKYTQFTVTVFLKRSDASST